MGEELERNPDRSANAPEETKRPEIVGGEEKEHGVKDEEKPVDPPRQHKKNSLPLRIGVTLLYIIIVYRLLSGFILLSEDAAFGVFQFIYTAVFLFLLWGVNKKKWGYTGIIVSLIVSLLFTFNMEFYSLYVIVGEVLVLVLLFLEGWRKNTEKKYEGEAEWKT